MNHLHDPNFLNPYPVFAITTFCYVETMSNTSSELILRTTLPNWSLTPTNITRVQKLEETAQAVRNRIAWCKGEYEYDGGERVDIEEERDESLLILEAEREGLDEEGGEDFDVEQESKDVEMGGA